MGPRSSPMSIPVNYQKLQRSAPGRARRSGIGRQMARIFAESPVQRAIMCRKDGSRASWSNVGTSSKRTIAYIPGCLCVLARTDDLDGFAQQAQQAQAFLVFVMVNWFSI